jgi:hypothetical protein
MGIVGDFVKSVVGGAKNAVTSDTGRVLTALATAGVSGGTAPGGDPFTNFLTQGAKFIGSGSGGGGGGSDPLTNILGTAAQIGSGFLADSFAPDAPVFGQGNQPSQGFTPSNVNISNPLFGTSQRISGNQVLARTEFSPEGLRLKGLFEEIRQREADAFAGFDRQGQVTEQQALLRSILEPTINTERNALLNSLNAQTGGVATTPGAQAALAQFGQQAAQLKAQQDIAAFDRATVEQDRLRGFESSSLRDLVDFQNIGAGQTTAAREVSSDIETANRLVAKENFETQGKEAAAESDFITEIFRGVVGGLGDIFRGGGTTSRTPDINPSSLFGGTSRSPFSSSRSQFNFGGFS